LNHETPAGAHGLATDFAFATEGSVDDFDGDESKHYGKVYAYNTDSYCRCNDVMHASSRCNIDDQFNPLLAR
jgi:hypothetical protein